VCVCVCVCVCMWLERATHPHPPRIQGDNFYESGIHGDCHNFRFNATFESVYNDPALQIPFYVVGTQVCLCPKAHSLPRHTTAHTHTHFHSLCQRATTTTSATSARRLPVSFKPSHSHATHTHTHIHTTHTLTPPPDTQYSRRWRFPNNYYKQSFTFPSTVEGDADGLTTVDFVMIDTVFLGGISDLLEDAPSDPVRAENQWTWIEEQLKASTADYLWVAGHYPVYSGCEHGSNFILDTRLRPLLEQYKATGYACGHDHCLQDLDDGGVHYVLSGAADNCCYHNKNENKLPAGALKFKVWNDGTGSPIIGGFASLQFTSQSMVAVYHAANGTVLYTTPPILPRSL
jgi:hypothetical protein